MKRFRTIRSGKKAGKKKAKQNKHALTCQTALPMVQPYIEGKLRDSDKEAFLSHVRACPTCYDELETYFIIYSSLATLDEDANRSFNMKQLLQDRMHRDERAILIRRRFLQVSEAVLAVTETVIALTAVIRFVPNSMFKIHYWFACVYEFLMR